jgi:hypothetical protein
MLTEGSQDADRRNVDERLQPFQPTSWSPDGKYVAVKAENLLTVSESLADLIAFPVSRDQEPIAVSQTAATETSAMFSPNGRYVAFTSKKPGQGEPIVFVQPFPGPGLKPAVSRGSGGYPVWRPDGGELFYIAIGGTEDGMLMSVPMGPDSRYEGAAPEPLFRPNAPRFQVGQIYAVTRDGQRFLVNGRQEAPHVSPITVIVNWPATLSKP